MYTHDTYVSAQFRAAVEAVEQQQLEVPIRVVAPGGSGSLDYARQPWSEAECQDFSAEFATEHGLTWVLYGARNRTTWMGREYFPPEATTDADPYVSAPFYDVLRRRGTDAHDMATVERGGLLMSEIEARVVYDLWGTGRASSDSLDWAALVTEPLLLCAAPDFVEQAEIRRSEALRQRVADYFNSVPQNHLNSVRGQIANHERSVSQNRQAITTSLRELVRLQAQADALLATHTRSAEDHLHEWQRLVDHPRAASVDFTADADVLIKSDDVTMHHPLTGETRWLGPLTFRINTTNWFVHVENEHTSRGGRAHPHAPGGEPCFGNLSATIAETISHGELVATFELLLQWAEGFNPRDDYGRFAALWFDVPDVRRNEDGELVEAELVAAGVAADAVADDLDLPHADDE